MYSIFDKNGKIGVIHWKHEETLRGQSMDIRPKPQDIIEWALVVGFILQN